MFKQYDVGVVIPVRLGSSRVIQKALLPVGDDGITLLAWKIRQLKLVLSVDQIYVSSESNELLDIAKKEGVIPLKRQNHLADGHKASFSEVITGVISDIPNEHVAWVTCVVPLMTPQEYLKAFKEYGAHVLPDRSSYDSLVSVNLLKEYFWDDSGPINYQANKHHTISQELPNIYRVTNGLYMAPKQLIMDREYLLGDNPYKSEVSKISGIDIDEYEDYEIAKDLMGVYEFKQKQQYSSKRIFLDFDGVVADSAKEAYVIAMLTSGKSTQMSDVDLSSKHAEAFLSQRYLIGPAWNYYYLLHAIDEKKADSFADLLPDEPGSEAKSFQDKFFATRAVIRNNFREDWLALNSMYEWSDSIVRLINKYENIVIVTTKDAETVKALLDLYGVSRPVEVFDNKTYEQYGCKSIFINQYIQENDIDRALFIDDSEKHLKKCVWVEKLELLQAKWGYVHSDIFQNNVQEVIHAIHDVMES